MLTIYSATHDRLVDRENGETPERFNWSKDAPVMGERLVLDAQKEWEVVHVEEYNCDGYSAWIAIVSPADAIVLPRSEWIASFYRHAYPDNSFLMLLDDQANLLSSGYATEGNFPEGRYEEFDVIGDSFECDGIVMAHTNATPTEWISDRAVTFLPVDSSSLFRAIYLVYHRREPIPVQSAVLAIV